MAEEIPVPATEPVVSVETAEAEPEAAPAAAEAAPAEQTPVEEPAAPAPVPELEPVAVVLTPPDPDRPKRAGWWSKAKSVLSGS
jgi:ribonuclease E